MSIPIRILEQINNSELNAADFYETYGQQEVEDSLKNLRESNQEILNKYTPEQMRVKVMEKIAIRTITQSTRLYSIKQNTALILHVLFSLQPPQYFCVQL